MKKIIIQVDTAQKVTTVTGQVKILAGMKCFVHRLHDHAEIWGISHFASGLQIYYHPNRKQAITWALEKIKEIDLEKADLKAKKQTQENGLVYPLNV